LAKQHCGRDIPETTSPSLPRVRHITKLQPFAFGFGCENSRDLDWQHFGKANGEAHIDSLVSTTQLVQTEHMPGEAGRRLIERACIRW
jgi:hypothetical protein